MSKTHKSFLRWFFDVILLQKVPHSRIFHELSSSPLISANPTQNFQSDSKWISPIDCKTAFGFRCAHSPQELSLPLPPSSLDPCLLVFECGGEKSIFFLSHISSEGRVRSFPPSFFVRPVTRWVILRAFYSPAIRHSSLGSDSWSLGEGNPPKSAPSPLSSSDAHAQRSYSGERITTTVINNKYEFSKKH